mgnify:FL=1
MSELIDGGVLLDAWLGFLVRWLVVVHQNIVGIGYSARVSLGIA